ncbi:MAG: hypothetical protein RBT69_11900 [Spirochaetia bacterium]|jgi:hypothetical protein|nr:hypothetical protein [Spirochaetia bacterium]
MKNVSLSSNYELFRYFQEEEHQLFIPSKSDEEKKVLSFLSTLAEKGLFLTKQMGYKGSILPVIQSHQIPVIRKEGIIPSLLGEYDHFYNKIFLYDNIIEKYQFNGPFLLEEVLLTHEFFHYLEKYHIGDVKKICLKNKIGKRRSAVLKQSSEVASHIFVKELLSLPTYPPSLLQKRILNTSKGTI